MKQNSKNFTKLLNKSLDNKCLTNEGKVYLLMRSSNNNIERLLKTNLKITSKSEIIRIIGAKKKMVPTKELKELVSTLENSDYNKIITSLDEIECAYAINEASFFKNKMSLSLKYDIGMNLLSFVDLLRSVESGEEVTFADAFATIPHPLGMVGLFAKKAIEDLNANYAAAVLEVVPKWSFVTNWEERYRGKHEFPNLPLYLTYADNSKLYNPNIRATSILIKDRVVAQRIFGFTPGFLNVVTNPRNSKPPTQVQIEWK